MLVRSMEGLMETNALVVMSGLIAALVAYGAIQDADSATAPATMEWKLGGSWTTSSAAIAALTAIAFLDTSGDAILVVFGVMLLLGPVLYKGLSGSGNASIHAFFLVGTVMGWATIAILATVGRRVFEITRFDLSLIPRLVLNGVAVAAVLAAIASYYTGLRAAASGGPKSASGSWTLP